MTVERAKELIEMYISDYCSDEKIKDNQKIHSSFVRSMIETLKKELN